ncbi:hypothetical protein MOSE0_J02036 [Monosporozyma servazzii]
MQLQTNITTGAEVNTFSHYYNDCTEFFIPSQSLYDGLTQKEIVDLQRGYVENSIISQMSSLSSKRYRLKNKIKRTLFKIQKNKEVKMCKGLTKSYRIDKKDDENRNISISRHESLLCYNQFKTSHPSLLFDLTMDTNRSNRSTYSQPLSVANRDYNILTEENILTNSLDKESSYYKSSPPLSASSMKRNNIQGHNFESKRLRLNNGNKNSARRFIVTNSHISSTKEKQNEMSYEPLPYELPKSPGCSHLSSSSDSSKLYSIPTFREERRELTISKLLGSIKLGNINLSSNGNIRLSYQDRSFYDNLAPDENSGIASKISKSLPSSPSTLASYECLIPDTSKIKFINKSSLLLYGKSHKRLAFSSHVSETKPILKNRLNSKKDVESEKARNCDIVGVEQFLKFLDNYEDRKSLEEKNCEELRKKQLMRYYKEETQYCINEHCDASGNSPPPLPPTFVDKNSKTRKRKITGLGQKDGLTKNVIL